MTIDTIIITDTETTGLDPATSHVIEVAIVVWDIESGSVRESYSSLIASPTNDAEAINRISVRALANAPHASTVWRRVNAILSDAGDGAVFMAHRAEFDRGFYPAELAAKLSWVCSKNDMEWPSSKLGASCVEMALAHGVPVVSAHRALTDCMLIARTLEVVHAQSYDVRAMLARAMRPKVLVAANTPKPWEMPAGEWDALKSKLLASGFRFVEVPEKRWQRSIARDDVAALPFETREVSP